MNLRLKIFMLACCACVVARLAEFHFQPKRIPVPAVETNTGSQSAASSESSARAISVAQIPAPVTENSPQWDLATGEKLIAEDPTDKNGQAGNFLLSLCAAGQFQLALKFANEAPSDLKSGWLKAVFTRWTQSHPQDALNALAYIQDDAECSSLFQTIASTWAVTDPSALANYAASLPDGDDKTCALNQVVDNWSTQDPKAFAVWLDTSPSGVNMDQAIADMVTKTDSANRTPQVAMEWVESINDPALRYNSLVQVLNQWNQNDSAAAQNYLASVQWLSDSQRQGILTKLQTPQVALSGAN
jgi:hypothetical protein